MTGALEFVIRAVLIGIGATAVLDLWVQFTKRVLGLPGSNWGRVGRWFGHFPRGRFVHDNIAEASPVRGELIIGWAAHYAIGIIFSAILLAIWGLEWARHPTLLPALIVGLSLPRRSVFHNAAGYGRRDCSLKNSEAQRSPIVQSCCPCGFRHRSLWIRRSLDAADPGIESASWYSRRAVSG